MFAKGRKENYSRMITITAVTGSALLQAYVMHVFMNPANLLAGGFTGIAILINKIAFLYGRQISTSLGMLLLNIPVAFMCMKSISPRFTLYSMLQVFFASFFLKIFHFTVLFEDIMLNVIFGGFLYGMSTAIALKGNASTGGTDFIALFVSNKIGRSIWEYVFAGNCIVLGIFGFLFGWPYAGYSILFQFVSTKTISAFHHRYERVTLQITTKKAKEIVAAYIESFKHGISSVEARGGYSGKKMYLLHTVVSSYEVSDAVRLLMEIDPDVIVNILKTQNFYGRFYHPPFQ